MLMLFREISPHFVAFSPVFQCLKQVKPTSHHGRMLRLLAVLPVTNSVTDFDYLSKVFAEADIGQHPSEWHGFLCGAVAGGALSGTALFTLATEELAADHTNTDDLHAMMEDFTKRTSAELNDGQYTLQLLLPDDEWPLSDRVEALAAWCQGYLSGLGQSGMASEILSEEAKTAIRDLSAIGQADSELEEDESEEQDYVQLVEYVRIAILMVHTELCSVQTPTPAAHTITENPALKH